MNQYLSQKLTFFSFWLIVLVVLLHSLNVQFNICDNWICSIQYFLSQKLTQIAVPTFFFISGYMFFLKADISSNLDFSFFGASLRKRFKTIVLPFIIWCAFWFMFMYGIQHISFLTIYFAQPLHKMSVEELMLNLFYYPLNYPFWFLRELFILVIFTPIIFVLVKYLKFYALVIILLLTIFFEKFIVIYDLGLLSTTPIFYFVFGSCCSLQRIEIIFKTRLSVVLILVIGWVILNIISLQNEVFHIFTDNFVRGFDTIKNSLGCFALWYSYDFLNKRKQWDNYSFYRYSFFIFAFHGIPTLLLVQASMKLFKDNSVLLAVSHFMIFFFIVAISIVLARATRKFTPRFYKILVGARD